MNTKIIGLVLIIIVWGGVSLTNIAGPISVPRQYIYAASQPPTNALQISKTIGSQEVPVQPEYTCSGDPSKSFTDVNNGNYFYPQVWYLACIKGFLGGYDQTQCQASGATFPCFLPYKNLTRAQLTVYLARTLKWQTDDTSIPSQCNFPDVPIGYFAYDTVRVACKRGVIRGYSDGEFHGENLIKRDEIAVMLVNAGGFDPYAPPSPTFRDVPSSYWAYSAIETARCERVVNGNVDGNYYPLRNVTRADNTIMVYNATNWAMNGPFDHCCYNGGANGQYPGSNNMIWNWNGNPNNWNPTTPGGRLFGVYTQTTKLGVYAKEIVWTDNAIQWLQLYGGTYVPTIVFHARVAPSNVIAPAVSTCSAGRWATADENDPIEDLPSSNLPNFTVLIDYDDDDPNCLQATEFRIFPSSAGGLRSQTNGGKYLVRAVWYAADTSYHDYIDVSNYHYDRVSRFSDRKDSLNKFCYDKSGGFFTYVGRCDNRTAPLTLFTAT